MVRTRSQAQRVPPTDDSEKVLGCNNIHREELSQEADSVSEGSDVSTPKSDVEDEIEPCERIKLTRTKEKRQEGMYGNLTLYSGCWSGGTH